MLKGRETLWTLHVIRGKGTLITMLEGTVKGKRKRGRSRLKLMDDVERGRYK